MPCCQMQLHKHWTPRHLSAGCSPSCSTVISWPATTYKPLNADKRTTSTGDVSLPPANQGIEFGSSNPYRLTECPPNRIGNGKVHMSWNKQCPTSHIVCHNPNVRNDRS
ncbi:hypothetical protein FGIG_09614 [Fasciola gigantica]|uniref:Uncharacterized protein n=1 Tax=Fasciola gigantica TaxID=46835 RepID=A0A504ZAN6_FASGI|nr:hypothetical protein FGIG_09614 [Fasciola gigantica]